MPVWTQQTNAAIFSFLSAPIFILQPFLSSCISLRMAGEPQTASEFTIGSQKGRDQSSIYTSICPIPSGRGKKKKTFLGTGDLEQNSAHDALAKSVAGLLVAAREAGKVSVHSVS